MIRITLVLMCLLVCPILAWANDSCDRAKGLYDQGKTLLKFEERRNLFLKAVELCPSFAEAHVNLADSYENLGDFDNAEKHYQEALKIRPDLSVAFIGMGEVYLKTGRYTVAKEAFSKGLEVSPDEERLLAGLKVVSERLKREKGFYEAKQIKDCLVVDEDFQLMCMCPAEHYEFIRKWVCVPPIPFQSGSASLSAQARRQLNEVGKALKSKELVPKKWIVSGHADSEGAAAENRRLSEGRARAVADYLVRRHGLDAKAFAVNYYGHERPRAQNTSADGRSENRRVEIVLDE
jgi:tetratricopeptide (TPR) repeat protein